MAQTQERRAETMSEMTWRNCTFPVRQERVRLFLLADKDLDRRLASEAKSSDKIETLERHLMNCKDAIAAAKEELKNDPVSV